MAGAAKKPSAPYHLIQKLTSLIIDENQPRFVITRTQNDYVVDYMRRLNSGGIIPLDYPVMPKHLTLIDNIGFSHPNLNPESLVIPNHYGGKPMIDNGPRPRSKDIQIRRFMNEINYSSGDARILIGLREDKNE